MSVPGCARKNTVPPASLPCLCGCGQREASAFPFQGSDDPAHALRRQAQVLGRLVDALFFKDPLKAADSMDVHGQDSLLSVIPLEQGLGPAVFHALGGQLVVEFFG